MKTDSPTNYFELKEIRKIVAENAYKEIIGNPTQYSSTNIY